MKSNTIGGRSWAPTFSAWVVLGVVKGFEGRATGARSCSNPVCTHLAGAPVQDPGSHGANT